jgi:hypothetical protein
MISAAISVIILISLICKVPLLVVSIHIFLLSVRTDFLIGILDYSHHDVL